VELLRCRMRYIGEMLLSIVEVHCIEPIPCRINGLR
jgi:hypothetical protein